jgi:hypothetical protein
MSWPLPAELAIKILDLISKNDPDSLNHTSLVHSSWRDYSQQLLFRTLKLTLYPTPPGKLIKQWNPKNRNVTMIWDATQEITPRLQALASPSSSRLRGHVRSLILKFPQTSAAKETEIWTRANEELLVEVLRGLPLDKLTTFELENKWESVFDYQHKCDAV